MQGRKRQIRFRLDSGCAQHERAAFARAAARRPQQRRLADPRLTMYNQRSAVFRCPVNQLK